jgi:RsiW-degrading membrane proteinase PrsW (M82 family)
MVDICTVVFILGVAFVPSLLYLVTVRNTERFGREPYGRLILMFGFGAVVSVLLALVLNAVVLGELMKFERLTEVGGEHFLGAVVVAPFVEELVKGLGLVFVLSVLTREQDGMVYGAAIGLGFAATENLLYEVTALSGGLLAYAVTAILRIISSTLLHATATSVTGYGVARAVVERRALLAAFPFYIVAVIMHATFNLIAMLPSTWPDTFGDWTWSISLLLTILFAVFAWRAMRARISEP